MFSPGRSPARLLELELFNAAAVLWLSPGTDPSRLISWGWDLAGGIGAIVRDTSCAGLAAGSRDESMACVPELLDVAAVLWLSPGLDPPRRITWGWDLAGVVGAVVWDTSCAGLGAGSRDESTTCPPELLDLGTFLWPSPGPDPSRRITWGWDLAGVIGAARRDTSCAGLGVVRRGGGEGDDST